MSLQSMFNRAAKGLAKQGFKQSMDGGSCVFRGVDALNGPNGTKCAIGHCVTDRELKTAVRKGCTIPSNFDTCKLAAAKFGTTLSKVYDLQYVHDECSGPEDMKQRLTNFAAVNGLKLPKELK